MAKQAVSTRDRPVALVEDIEDLFLAEMAPPRFRLDAGHWATIAARARSGNALQLLLPPEARVAVAVVVAEEDA